MTRSHVSDATCVLSLFGLKYVAKDDVRFPGLDRAQFYLDCAYKGHVKRIIYATKEERDTMFDAIAAHFNNRVSQ